MKKEEQEQYKVEYKKAKEKGVPFFPDIIFKDVIISFLIFAVLVALAYFLGAPLEERANPTDASYTPEPEWYFLFLYQALKYFPGQLEVIGAVVLPTIFIGLMFALPFIDRSTKRHISGRPVALGSALVAILFIGGMTAAAKLEPLPPSEVVASDPGAVLYVSECAECHGPSPTWPEGTNFAEVLLSGGHEGIVEWETAVFTDEESGEANIAYLSDFFRAPRGTDVYAQECSDCHQLDDFAETDPLLFQHALLDGADFPGHEKDTPNWASDLSQDRRNGLLSYLAGSEDARLYADNCAGCHGRDIQFEGETEELRQAMFTDDLHSNLSGFIPLTEQETNVIAAFLEHPPAGGAGNVQEFYIDRCSPCHGSSVPDMSSSKSAVRAIEESVAHQDAVNWTQQILPEQEDALVAYTAELAEGGGVALGAQLYQEQCTICHGVFGEGGVNPARPGDIIAPISSAEYLRTRNDLGIKNIISYGQPNFGMSPYGVSNGGPLENEEIDAIVAFMRNWEANPPVDLPPDVDVGLVAMSGEKVFQTICAECHGANGEGGIAPSLNSPYFRETYTDEDILDIMLHGHEGTTMIPWGSILTANQVNDVIDYIAIWGGPQEGEEVSFSEHLQPLFNRKCSECHGTNLDAGDWRADSYEFIMESGEHAPLIMSGDPDNSILVQKITNKQDFGDQMPIARLMNPIQIQWIVDWIEAGSPNN